MAKINFKYDYGQQVLTSISERPGRIELLHAFTSSGVIRYTVSLDFPYKNQSTFKNVQIVFNEDELSAIG